MSEVIDITSGSILKRIREMIRENLGGRSEASAPELAREIAGMVLEDRDFAATILQDGLVGICYKEAQRFFTDGRRRAVVFQEETVMRRDEFERRAKSRWATWYEHSGDKHFNLLDMTRGQLLGAALERMARADTERRRAEFLRGLAERVEDGKTLRECLSDSEISQIAQANGVIDAVG